MFDLKKLYKDAAEAIQLESVSLAAVIKFTKADSLRPSASPRFGSRIFLERDGERCANAAGKVFSALRISGKLTLENEWMSAEAIAEIMQKEEEGKIKLYVGETDNGPWMAFGSAGEFTPGVAYSLKELNALVGTTA